METQVTVDEKLRRIAELVLAGEYDNIVVIVSGNNGDGGKQVVPVYYGDVYACSKIAEIGALMLADTVYPEQDA